MACPIPHQGSHPNTHYSSLGWRVAANRQRNSIAANMFDEHFLGISDPICNENYYTPVSSGHVAKQVFSNSRCKSTRRSPTFFYIVSLVRMKSADLIRIGGAWTTLLAGLIV